MASKKYSDQEIIKGILNTEPPIYQFLDAMFYQKVINHVCRNSGSKEDGEELYQDVILEIYLCIEQGKYDLDKPRTFEQHFWMMVKRRWIDRLRSRGKTVHTSQLNETTRLIANNSEAEETAADIYNKMVAFLGKCLEKLTEEEQSYVKLFYYSRKSLQAIADHFGTTYDYARLKMHRIRKKLRKMVSDDPELGTLFY